MSLVNWHLSYDVDQKIESNLGAIGVIIAHEITHSFDPTGAKFDEKGNMNEWWKQEDYKKFQEKTNKVKAFYNQIEVMPGYKVNGALTLGENIADIGAVATTLDIMREMKGANYEAFF